MLEDLAAQYLHSSDTASRLVNSIAVITGGALSGIRKERRFELYRAPFFALYTLLLLFLVLIQFVQLSARDAMAYGFVWGIVAVHISGWLISGFVFGVIAAARSRNASGNSKGAIKAFIPPLNVHLFFAKPRHDAPPQHETAMNGLRGAGGVAIGFTILLFATGFLSLQLRMLEQERKNIQASPQKKRLITQYLIRGQGLQGALRTAKNKIETPKQIGTFTLQQVKNDETMLIFTYNLDTPAEHFSETEQADHAAWVCDDIFMSTLLQHGATMRHVYNSGKDGSDAFIVDEKMCEEKFNE